MLPGTENINSKLLFIISFSLTALAIYLFKFASAGSALLIHHSFIQNVFFINVTFLGSGIFCIGFILYLFYKKKNLAAGLITGSALITFLIIQGIKNYLAHDGIQIFFEDEQSLFSNTAKEIVMFPSAHTALAFNLATVLALYFKNNLRTFYLFTIAGIVAYSRIYVDHHTVPDLFAGAFTGMVSAAISFYFYLNYFKIKKPRYSRTQKFNKPAIQ